MTRQGRGTRVAVAVAGSAAALLMLVGCTRPEVGGVGPRVAPTQEADRGTHGAGGSTLDSPELASLRAQARVAPCPEPSRSAGASGTAADAGPAGTRPLPEVTLPCLGQGPDVALGALSGRPSVLNVWAQWCPPCRKEAPHFQALYERAGDRLLVLGIDYDDPRPELALKFAHDLGLKYPQVADPDKRLRAPFGIIALPATIFVDARGRVVHIAHQVYESEQTLRRDVRTYLGVEL
ncbi:TlpA family protein disulfide reductase [Actinopolymorpha alba]|uniref:TlpA family protein disulfide reductase n=1 Tax=Actinopolymorpha alba TaxID=533267 RepID=UPI000377B5C3|nr:TlpA disulfide reductase family protein [Actinopolymorpha alba]